jgi:pimeloyl-ACP methyl ester carboxylesterase
MAYETILGFEERNRMVIVDISAFDDPDEMSRGINLVLEEEEVDRVVLMGQSLSGILAQLYFRRHANRVEALVLTNTLAPKRERCRKWPQLLFRWLGGTVARRTTPMIARRCSIAARRWPRAGVALPVR